MPRFLARALAATAMAAAPPAAAAVPADLVRIDFEGLAWLLGRPLTPAERAAELGVLEQLWARDPEWLRGALQQAARQQIVRGAMSPAEAAAERRQWRANVASLADPRFRPDEIRVIQAIALGRPIPPLAPAAAARTSTPALGGPALPAGFSAAMLNDVLWEFEWMSGALFDPDQRAQVATMLRREIARDPAAVADWARQSAARRARAARLGPLDRIAASRRRLSEWYFGNLGARDWHAAVLRHNPVVAMEPDEFVVTQRDVDSRLGLQAFVARLAGVEPWTAAERRAIAAAIPGNFAATRRENADRLLEAGRMTMDQRRALGLAEVEAADVTLWWQSLSPAQQASERARIAADVGGDPNRAYQAAMDLVVHARRTRIQRTLAANPGLKMAYDVMEGRGALAVLESLTAPASAR